LFLVIKRMMNPDRWPITRYHQFLASVRGESMANRTMLRSIWVAKRDRFAKRFLFFLRFYLPRVYRNHWFFSTQL